MKKILVFGTGQKTKDWITLYLKKVFCAVEIVGYIDNNENKWNTEFLGKKVYSPNEIKNLEYDKIVICLKEEFYSEVYQQLVLELQVPIEKVGNVYWLVNEQKNPGSKNKKQANIPRVYDCFIFYNELELLELRLEMLNPVVDYFVLVEMKKTVSGLDKPLYFAENRDRYKEYAKKIIYICPDDIPLFKGGNREELGYKLDQPQLEFMRDCILRGLKGCEPEDIILYSDLDEFPKPEKIDMLKTGFGKLKPNAYAVLLDTMALQFEQDFFYYSFNCKQKIKWYGTYAVKYKNLTSIACLREVITEMPYITDGGWHFSYFGGTQRVKNKLMSFNDGVDVEIEKIEVRIKNRKDVMGRNYYGADEMDYVDDISTIGIPNLEMFVNKYPYLCQDR